MKIILIAIAIAIIGLVACSKGLQMKKEKIKDGEWCDGIQASKSVLPFWDVELKQARFIAHRKVKYENRTTYAHQLIVVILHPDENEAEAVKAMGFENADLEKWEERYYGILLKADSPDAKEIIDQYNIQDFPATIKETKSIDGTETFFKVWYGYLPEVSGNNEYDVRSIVQSIYTKYKGGEKDQKLLVQLRDHIELLELAEEEREQLYFQITNDYLNQFSTSDFKNFTTYREVKREFKDVRFDLTTAMLNNRDFYNQAFKEVCETKEVKANNRHEADWMLEQAILKSFQKAAKYNDSVLFRKASEVKDQYNPGYMTTSIAKAILEFQIQQNNQKAIREAALQYFAINKNWVSTRSEILEASAKAIDLISEDAAEWELAEKWIARAIEKYPNPTSYRLQANLLKKLERTEDYENVLNKITGYTAAFKSFVKLYPKKNYSIELEQNDIAAKAYKGLRSIDPEYKMFYRYIARESSIYKKGQKIEPIALLAESEEYITLLTRVHLVTGSILPVSHYRSYYIKSKFTRDGEHIRSEYVLEAFI